jgi:hypothetical protein
MRVRRWAATALMPMFGGTCCLCAATKRSPGQYAEERHRRGLRSYRRRMRRPVLLACVPAIVVATAVAIWLDRDPWWWFAGGVTGGMAIVAMLVLGSPPEHIAKWGRGAAGERRTAKVLRPLIRKGWTVAHDVPHGRTNFDHVLVGPPGVFLLETKFRAGRLRLEDGVLTIRYADDPDEVFTLPRLGVQVRGRAKGVCATLRSENCVPGWVTPVVVLWADFPARHVEHDGVIYIHGDEVVDWLRSLSSANLTRPHFAWTCPR